MELVFLSFKAFCDLICFCLSCNDLQYAIWRLRKIFSGRRPGCVIPWMQIHYVIKFGCDVSIVLDFISWFSNWLKNKLVCMSCEFLTYYQYKDNYIWYICSFQRLNVWCMELSYNVHVCLAGFILPWPNFHDSLLYIKFLSGFINL